MNLTDPERRNDMEQEIITLLKEEYPEIDFSSDSLVEDGLLDSLTITGIITLLSMEYGIEVPYEEIVEENFNSAAGLCAMVKRLQQERD